MSPALNQSNNNSNQVIYNAPSNSPRYCVCALMESTTLTNYEEDNTFIYNVSFKIINSPTNSTCFIINVAVNANSTYGEFIKELNKLVKKVYEEEHTNNYYCIIPLDERENGRDLPTYLMEEWELNANNLKMSDILTICKCKYTNISAFYAKYVGNHSSGSEEDASEHYQIEHSDSDSD